MKEITVISLDLITKNNWVFKVSANDYENGVLVFAKNDVYSYYRCRYFSNHNDARGWINSLVLINEKTLSELEFKNENKVWKRSCNPRSNKCEWTHPLHFKITISPIYCR